MTALPLIITDFPTTCAVLVPDLESQISNHTVAESEEPEFFMTWGGPVSTSADVRGELLRTASTSPEERLSPPIIRKGALESLRYDLERGISMGRSSGLPW